MIIEITQNDINLGTPHSMGFCPIALAVGRKFDTYVEVSIDGIRIKNKYFKISQKCKSFISNFDYNIKPVYPFKFKLMIKP